MGSGPERALQSRIVKAIKREHPDAWIFNVVGSPYQMTGVPDLVLCVDGVLVGAEVKHRKPGESLEHAAGRATPQQRVQIQRILTAGGMAGVVTSPEEALDLIGRGLSRVHRDAE